MQQFGISCFIIIDVNSERFQLDTQNLPAIFNYWTVDKTAY